MMPLQKQIPLPEVFRSGRTDREIRPRMRRRLWLHLMLYFWNPWRSDRRHMSVHKRPICPMWLHQFSLPYATRLLLHICLKTSCSRYCCKNRCTDCYADFISKRDKCILKPVIADTGFPFAIFYTIGNNGINSRVKTCKEEPCQTRTDIKRNRCLYRTEQIQRGMQFVEVKV